MPELVGNTWPPAGTPMYLNGEPLDTGWPVNGGWAFFVTSEARRGRVVSYDATEGRIDVKDKA